jgi:hypothetical protein
MQNLHAMTAAGTEHSLWQIYDPAGIGILHIVVSRACNVYNLALFRHISSDDPW